MKILLSILLITLIACSPVRNRYMSKSNSDEDKNKNISQNTNSNDLSSAETGAEYFNTDTVYRTLPPLIIENGKENQIRSLNAELDSAIYLFRNGNYEVACEKFSVLQETLKQQDSLYHEAVFYSAECLIVNNEYTLASRLLNDLMNDELSNNLKPRVLLRQGHIRCALGDEETAKWYFDKLLAEYPDSFLVPLADCNSLD